VSEVNKQVSKVEELLTNYLAYRHAVIVYERHKPYPSAAIANYNGMPSGSGAPELFFSLVGKPADMGYTTDKDYQDYQGYKIAVVEIEGALATLTEEQYAVIKLKWMHDVTLKQIATRKHAGHTTIKTLHRTAMARLRDALRFTDVPAIETHQTARVSTF
jgi:hypothetical protein